MSFWSLSSALTVSAFSCWCAVDMLDMPYRFCWMRLAQKHVFSNVLNGALGKLGIKEGACSRDPETLPTNHYFQVVCRTYCWKINVCSLMDCGPLPLTQYGKFPSNHAGCLPMLMHWTRLIFAPGLHRAALNSAYKKLHQVYWVCLRKMFHWSF